jgi:CheY-like chemotaxis protein/HPt (histidine-containing phosphotransfer) domain-containing protein
MGFTIEIASDGLEAFEAAQKCNYELIFMDVQMPEVDGLEATRRIRSLESETGRPPSIIIAMTASAMHGDREKCLRAGMDDYLAKPVRPEAVQAVIEHWGPLVRAVPGRAPVSGAGAGSRGTTRLRARPGKATEAGVAPATVAAPAPAAEAPIDLERLTELSGGDAAGLADLSELYFGQTAPQLAELRAAVLAGNVGEIRRLAHKVAGASATCGMNAIVAPMRRLEIEATENRLVEPLKAVEEGAAALERMRVFLEAYRAASQGGQSA